MCIYIVFGFVNVINVSVCKHVDTLTYFSAQMLSKLITVSWKTTQQTLKICSSLKSGCSQIRKHSSIYQHATDSAAGSWFKELKCNDNTLSLPIKSYKNRLETRKDMETSKICNIVSLQTQFDTIKPCLDEKMTLLSEG